MESAANKAITPFANPFAGGPGWELKYTYTSRNFKGINKIWEESGDKERDKKIARIISNGIFMTSVQVYQSGIVSMGLDNLKKKLNLLSRGFFLIKHTIEHDNKSLPIYTIGPASCEEALEVQYRTNFYKRYSLTQVLKVLSVNQLCVRLFKDNYVKVNYNVMNPFTAEIEFINRKYGNPYENRDKAVKLSVISLRNYDVEQEEFVRQIPKVKENTIIIAHDLSAVEKHTELLNDNFRVTTDTSLFKDKVSEILYKAEGGRLVKQTTTIFE